MKTEMNRFLRQQRLSATMKSDFFSLILRFGGSASYRDWMNHCDGISSLINCDTPLLKNTLIPSPITFSSESTQFIYDVIEDDGKYEAYDENDPQFSMTLSFNEICLWELDILNFAKWLQKILQIPSNIRHKLLMQKKVLLWEPTHRSVFVYLGNDWQEFQSLLETASDKGGALILILFDAWLENAGTYEIICRYNLSVYNLSTLVQTKSDRYQYVYETPFKSLIQMNRKQAPNPEFLPRPHGTEWSNLVLKLQTNSHTDYLSVEKDVLIAFYVDENGKQIGELAKKPIRFIKTLYRGRKLTLAGIMLKQFAAGNGRCIVEPKDNRNLLNGVRNTLRKLLCEQFGFSSDDNPIIYEAKNVYRTVFSIDFTDSHSDPLAPTRFQARRRLTS